MRHARDADFDSSTGRVRCLKDTRVDVLDELMAWALDLDQDHSQQLYWLNGHAGSGKTTVAQSFAEFLFSIELLGASFFCSRDSSDRSDLSMIIPTIAYQLAISSNPAAPVFRDALLRALRKNPDLPFSSLQNQLDRLIVQPIEESKMTTVVVIDALDECKDESTTSTLLWFLAQNVGRIPSVKFFITGRPEQHIRSGFRLEPIESRTDTMVLHLIEAKKVEADIRRVLEAELTALALRRRELKLPPKWYTEDQVDQLVKKCAGLFVFASTVVKALDRRNSSPLKRMEKLLSDPTIFKHEGEAGLNKLYGDILNAAILENDTELPSTLRSILGMLVVSRNLISITTIVSLLSGDIDTTDVRDALDGLHSVLVIPDEDEGLVRFHHKSFADFLTDPSRCQDLRFLINRDDHEFTTAQRCLKVMEHKLEKNICGMKRYSTNDSVPQAVRDKCIDGSLIYSCRYWGNHILSDSHLHGRLGDICESLDVWFRTRLLQWLEVLGLLRELAPAVKALAGLRDRLSSV
jgi:hypothetical protein